MKIRFFFALLTFVTAFPAYAGRTVYFLQTMRPCSPDAGKLNVMLHFFNPHDTKPVTIKVKTNLYYGTDATGKNVDTREDTLTIAKGGVWRYTVANTVASTLCPADAYISGSVEVTEGDGFVVGSGAARFPEQLGGYSTHPVTINAGQPF